MSQLQIYKASAGSGKTFRLAIEYLKIALLGEWNYKHVLAVTFTNKATTEMKYRVMQELHHLSIGQETAYMEVLKDELGLAEIEISLRAQKCLKHVLHDYSRFSISTIDSFFQRVIKAFNRELGINTAYQVDLNDEQVLEEAVDELLLSIDKEPVLLDWLRQFAREKIQEGAGWNLKGDILKLGKQIYNDTFKELNKTLYEKLNDKSFITEYRSQLRQIIVQFENTLKEIGNKGTSLIESSGLSVNDFKYGKGGPVSSFYKLQNSELTLGKRVLDAVNDVTALYKIPDKNGVGAVASQLQPLLVEVVNFYIKEIRNYNTAKLIVSQLYVLGILVDLQEMVRKVTREKGVVLLSESGTLLQQIIGESETPFVYEKTGVYYQHFMIDEFQDTSGLQWNNFKPLIGNSLSEDNLSLVVGDVKQAIYRFRKGDWSLLASGVSKAFPANGVSEETLLNNWRSSGNVIRFNNRIFQVVPFLLQQRFAGDLESAGLDLPLKEQIQHIYHESVQEIGKKDQRENGYVRMSFYEQKKKDEETAQQVLDDLILQIKRVQDSGAKANEIAVLVRTKDQARVIADCLLLEKNRGESNYNFSVLSSESLYVKNSPSVAFVLSLLKLLVNPDDKIALSMANYYYHQDIFSRLKIIGKRPLLKQFESQEQLTVDFCQHKEIEVSAIFESLDDWSNELLSFLKSEYFKGLLSLGNLQELVFKLCDVFNLFNLTDDLAYLQAFIDQISVFVQNRMADVSAFLSWWDNEGASKTIAVSEDLDAIRILTIHKSKGLEYNNVFIPFCDWQLEISTNFAPFIWCKPNSSPFNQLELVPVKYGKKMADSIFFEEYFTETLNNYIDKLNLLYVAFTRARNSLFVWASYGSKSYTCGDLMKDAVQKDDSISRNGNEILTESLAENYNEEKQLLEIGTLQSVSVDNDKEMNSVMLREFRFSDFDAALKIRKNHEDFFVSGETVGKSINRGRLIHEVLARISTANELEQAVSSLVFNGMLGDTEAGTITKQLKELLSDEEVISWFDGTYKVFNERNIMTGANGLKRPDRIMLKDDHVIVVDYKSGEMELGKYKSQVRMYMRELRNCGYPNVSGYIWYTRNNKRIKVN